MITSCFHSLKQTFVRLGEFESTYLHSFARSRYLESLVLRNVCIVSIQSYKTLIVFRK